MSELSKAHRVVLRAIKEQYESIAGPPTSHGLAWAIVNALTEAGWDMREDSQLVAMLRALKESDR